MDEEDRRPQAGVPGGEGQPQDLPARAGVRAETGGEEAVHRRPPVRPGHLKALHPDHLHHAQRTPQTKRGGRGFPGRAAEVLGQAQGRGAGPDAILLPARARRPATAVVPARGWLAVQRLCERHRQRSEQVQPDVPAGAVRRGSFRRAAVVHAVRRERRDGPVPNAGALAPEPGARRRELQRRRRAGELLRRARV